MNKAEAKKLKTFKHICNCGGYAYSINGRDPRRPHMTWCPQYAEYNEWWDALHDEGDVNADNKH